MLKILFWAVLLYFAYRYFLKPQAPLQRPPREEPLPKREREKQRAEEDYIDYEEVD